VEPPLLSVVIPTYDRPSTLANCLESIALQCDFSDFEIVVVDNATPAPEENERIIKQYRRRFDKMGVKVNYVRHKDNLGIVDNKHAGIKLAKGRFVVISDDDDFYIHRYFFAKAISALLSNPDSTVLICRTRKVFDDNTQSWFDTTLTNKDVSTTSLNWKLVNGNQYFKGFWTKFLPCQCNAVIACRRTLVSSGWFDIHCNDQSFHLLPAVNHNVLVSEDVVAVYRKHQNEQINGNSTRFADPHKCFESHTAIESWIKFAGKEFSQREFFVSLVWRTKNILLKDEGVVSWLSHQGQDKLTTYYRLIREYNTFHYIIVRYFSLVQTRRDLKLYSSDTPDILRYGLCKLRRRISILILKLDRLIH
jgi:glycosyltransferase involved in cell wall biosynthesis